MANHFVHCELATSDTKKARQFYGKVFDWKFEDMPQFKYTGIDTGVMGSGGGIYSKHDVKAPTAWMPYVSVKSVKATVAKAQKAGAKVDIAYHSVGDMGALGVFTDPTGATIGVWETNMTAPKSASTAAKKPAKKTAKKPAKKTAKPVAKKAVKKAPAKKAKKR